MALDGLWIAQFTGKEVSGSGVVVFSNGKLFGGETGFYYIGTYESDGKSVRRGGSFATSTLRFQVGLGYLVTTKWTFPPRFKDDKITGTAMIANQPQHSLGVRLTKKANL